MDPPPNPVLIYGRGNVGRDNLTNVGNQTTYNIQYGTDQDLLQALRKLVVPEAMHDSKEVDKEGTCYPGTRVIVLEDVTAWVQHLDPEFTIKWMKGAAGAGKSAIARTVAKLLAKDGLLLASFFCWRSSESRSDGSRVIPTLVDQIIAHIPSIRPVIEEAFRRDPHLLTKSMEIQATRLIIEPLASIKPALRQSLPRVIVIDGLDEIKGTEAQRDILKMVAFLVDNLPFTIHFFIASRPEHQIQECFTQSMGNRWSAVSLDETQHPDRDILIYYKAHFSLIVVAFPAFELGPDWPGEAVRRVLVGKGSGQFIFAAIVIRFVGNTSISISPQKRLDAVLERVSNDRLRPLELLDQVYVTVFAAVPKEELEDLLQLVGLVLWPGDFKKSPRVLDAVLCLEPGTTLNRLRYLHSVLKVPPSPHETIAPLHATLGDFIFNRGRSHSFGLYVDQEQLRQGVVLGILKGSMIHTASERLNDCRDDWFEYVYLRPILRTLTQNPTFRNTLASHIEEAQRRDITLWPPLALTGTYRVALAALAHHSSWFNIMDNFSWQSLEKKMNNEKLRRLQSYVTMGLTGHLLVFLQLTLNRRDRGTGLVDAFLKALPDQNFLAAQKLTGLALPCDDLNLGHTDTKKFAETFFKPDFVETFFILLPCGPFDSSPLKPLDLYMNFFADLSSADREVYFARLLSLRNLPQNDPRWSNDAKGMFDSFMEKLCKKIIGRPW